MRDIKAQAAADKAKEIVAAEVPKKLTREERAVIRRAKRNAKLQIKRDAKRAEEALKPRNPITGETEDQEKERLARLIFERRKQAKKELYTKSLSDFAKAAWPLIDPAPLQWNWHHEAIAEALTAVKMGQIKNLLINLPPGHSKSSLCSVLYPAWEWISNPAQTWLCTSFAYDLAMRDSAQCRRLVESPWYRDLWGDKVRIMDDANQVERYKTTVGGHRVTGSPGGRGLGDGGNRCMIDDPHPSDKESMSMEDVWNWYTGVFFNRVRDPKIGARIVVGHRMNMRDLSGRIIDSGGFVHLCFQQEYEPEHRCVISTPTYQWDKDPRTEPGELLWKDRYDAAAVEEIKKATPAAQYSARYQQRAIPAGGYQFKREWFKYFGELGSVDGPQYVLGDRLVSVKSCRRVAIVDPACVAKKVGNKPCFTVCMIGIVTPDNDVLIDHIYRRQEESTRVVEDMRMILDQFSLPFLWIEKAGIGIPIIQFCLKAGIPVRDIPAKLSKQDRAQAAEIWFGRGKIYFRKGAPWLPTLERELETFPQSEYADQTDCLAHLCGLMRDSNKNDTSRGSGVISFSGMSGRAINVVRAG